MAKEKKFNYGGQAVIEGVMMRGRKAVVTAVRQPGGTIVHDVRPVPAAYNGRMRRIPLLRGVISLVESLVLGMKSLFYSANVAVSEENEEISTKAMLGMILTAVALVVVLFFLAPLFLTKLVNPILPNDAAFMIVEGVIRLGIFIAYLALISLMPDIKRVFAYHGAEHKTINAYEAGVPLEPEAIQAYSTRHLRCGTSFLLVVMIIAVIVFSFIGRQDMWLMVLSRVVLIPVVAAISYEFIFFTARYDHNRFVKLLAMPGLFVQAMTTREPDDRQIEVAAAALQKALEVDAGETSPQEAAPPENNP